MRYTILLALGAALFAAPAMAQQSVSGSSSNVVASSGAQIINNGASRIRSSNDQTASAFAPGLAAAGLNSCAGSTSVGVGITGLNVGAGSTYEMEECTRRANAVALASLGQNLAALESLCQSPKMKAALNASGTLCPSQRFEAEQAEANRRGTFYSPEAQEAEPVLAAPRRKVRRTRRNLAIAAQVSNSDASISQANGGRFR